MEKIKNSQKNPWIISYGSSEYHGQPIKTLTPIHQAQEIHKYRLGLFVTGIIGLCAAIGDLILIAMAVVKGEDIKGGVSTGVTTMSIVFVITLLIDIVLTINLNRYVKEKRWLILYIPCFVSMIFFSVPQILTLISVFGIKMDFNIGAWKWANYVNIAVCLIFVIAEGLRMYWHRNDLDLKQEMKRALK